MFRGRRLQTLQAAVLRPTQDRVREALFSSLADRIPGCGFLDLYAGIGTVGIEAWSRGAARVCWVENQRRIFQTLRNNVRLLSEGGESGVRLEPCGLDVRAFCKRVQAEAFDVVYADPPYARNRAGGEDVLGMLAAGALVKPDGMVVLEQGADEPAAVADELWRLVQERRYGGSVLRYFVWRNAV